MRASVAAVTELPVTEMPTCCLGFTVKAEPFPLESEKVEQA